MDIENEIFALEALLLREFNHKTTKASSEDVLDTDIYYTISELIELANEAGADLYDVQVTVGDGEIVVRNMYKETDAQYLDRLKRTYDGYKLQKDYRRMQWEALNKEFGENK